MPGFGGKAEAIGVSGATFPHNADTIERRLKEARYFQGVVIT